MKSPLINHVAMTVKNEVPFDSNDGDSIIAMTLTDRDPQTDADGVEKGTIVDPGALALASGGGSSSGSGGGGGGSCFIKTAGGEFSWVGFFFIVFAIIRYFIYSL